MSLEPLPPTARIAILRFSAVGDVVLTSGAVSALKRALPRSTLLFVTKAALQPLVAHHPDVDDVLSLAPNEGTASLRRRLAASFPDAILDLHGKARGLLLRSLVPRRRRVLWTKRPLAQELAVRLLRRPYRAEMHIAARYHLAVEQLVGRNLERAPLSLGLDPDAVQAIDARLTQRGLGARPLVGLAPGAMWPTKRWPLERFVALAERIVAAGADLVVTGSAAERTWTAAIARAVPAAHDLAGALTLGELAALVARCAAFVANDSGPMHMARALRIPTLTFFGSTDPAQFDFTGHALMVAGVPCAPCSLYGLARCPQGHFRCMLDLEVDGAWRALDALLTSPPPAPSLG